MKKTAFGGIVDIPLPASPLLLLAYPISLEVVHSIPWSVRHHIDIYEVQELISNNPREISVNLPDVMQRVRRSEFL